MLLNFFTSPVSGGGYILEDYPAFMALSFRRLLPSDTYTGPCIRVRRSIDNVETNIGFDGDYIDTVALVNFSLGGNVFLTKWYDQSGNAKDRFMSVASYQPRIVTSGAITYFNSKVVLIFDVLYMSLLLPTASVPTGFYSNFEVYNNKSVVGNIKNNSGASKYGWFRNSNDSASPFGGMTAGTDYVNGVVIPTTTRTLLKANIPSNQWITHNAMNYYINGWGTYHRGYYAVQGGSFAWYGQMSEEIIFTGNSSAFRTIIEDDQIAYYGL